MAVSICYGALGHRFFSRPLHWLLTAAIQHMYFVSSKIPLRHTANWQLCYFPQRHWKPTSSAAWVYNYLTPSFLCGQPVWSHLGGGLGLSGPEQAGLLVIHRWTCHSMSVYSSVFLSDFFRKNVVENHQHTELAWHTKIILIQKAGLILLYTESYILSIFGTAPLFIWKNYHLCCSDFSAVLTFFSTNLILFKTNTNICWLKLKTNQLKGNP